MTATLKLDSFLPYRLSVASNRVSSTIASAYHAQFGLRIPEWRLVCVLAEFGAMSQQAMCGRTQMDKVTVSRAAVALLERGFVRRTPNPLDLRSHLLSLTAQGQDVYRQVTPQALAVQARIFEDFSPTERDTLAKLLARAHKAGSV